MSHLAVYIFVAAYAALALAVPVEMWISHRRRDGNYRTSEATTSLALALLYQLTEIGTRGVALLPFLAVSQLSPWRLPFDRTWGWLVGFVLVDFVEYWQHRAMHRVNILWAAHEVHHSGEDYNLATGPRQALYVGLVSLPLKLPLALVVPFPMYATLEAASLIYALFLHTRYVRRLGPLEELLNTPSHHRVHHARNQRYLDRNHGAVLILWDRLFGTFEREEEAPLFGVTRPLSSHGLVDAHLHHLRWLVALTRATPRLADKLRLWLAPPEWVPPGAERFVADADAGEALLDPAGHRLPDSRAGASVRAYVSLQLLLAVPALPLLSLGADRLSAGARLAVVALVVAAVGSLGALLASERGARRWELVRVAGTTALVAAAVGPALAPWVSAVGAASFLWAATLRRSDSPVGVATKRSAAA